MITTNNKNRTASGDLLWSQDIFGQDGDTPVLCAQVRVYADANGNAGKVPARFEFWAMNSSGALTKAFSVNSAGVVSKLFAAPAAKTTDATLTAAEVLGGMITGNQGATASATYTLPTGVLLSAAFPVVPTVGDSFDFTVTNISTDAGEDVTILGGVGTTLIGSGAVASNAAATDKSAGTFRFRNTGAGTWDVFRIG